jgi:hypothetical protein
MFKYIHHGSPIARPTSQVLDYLMQYTLHDARGGYQQSLHTM